MKKEKEKSGKLQIAMQIQMESKAGVFCSLMNGVWWPCDSAAVPVRACIYGR